MPESTALPAPINRAHDHRDTLARQDTGSMATRRRAG